MEPSVRPTAATEARAPVEVRLSRCQRVGCTAEVGFVVRFETDALQMRVHPGADGPAVARLCPAHAARLRPPQGWTRVDVGGGSVGDRAIGGGETAVIPPSAAEVATSIGSSRRVPAVVGPLLARALANTADLDAAAETLFGVRRAVG